MKLEMEDRIGLTEHSDDETDEALINDIHPEDLAGQVSQVLHQSYLAEMDCAEQWPTSGTIYGLKRRCMICLALYMHGTARAVHFLVDTTSSLTTLALGVFQAFGVPHWDICNVNLKVNGVVMRPAVTSDVRAVGLNILGQDFMERAPARLDVRYAAGV